MDPDPGQSEKLDPDPHQSDKRDPGSDLSDADPHLNIQYGTGSYAYKGGKIKIQENTKSSRMFHQDTNGHGSLYKQ